MTKNRNRRKKSSVKGAVRSSGPAVTSVPIAPSTNTFSTVTTSRPRFRTIDSGIVICHTETSNLAIQTNVGTFNLVGDQWVNPGNPVLFPWLGTLAANFEQYRFRSLVLEFVPTTATTTMGTVVIAMDYDAADAPPSNLAGLMAFMEAGCCSPWTRVSLPQTRVWQQGTKYVRLGLLADNLDVKTYDVGKLFVALDGLTSANLLGFLRVHYEIELVIPQIRTFDMMVNSSSARIVGSNTNPTIAAPLGATITSKGGLPFEYEVKDGSGRLKFLLPGDYIVTADVTGTGLGNFSLNNDAGAARAADSINDLIGSPTARFGEWFVSTPIGGVVALALSAATTITSSKVRISPYPKTSFGT